MKLKYYLGINWPESNGSMTYHKNMTEDEQILYFTDWRIQKQFGYMLYEIGDKDTKTKKGSGGAFTRYFSLMDVEYIYQAIKMNDIWVILFHPIKEEKFGNIKGNVYVGNVMAGVFQSTRELINTQDVDKIGFNTDDKDLIRFYDKMITIIEKRLPVKFIRYEIKGKHKSYYFEVIK